MVFIVVTEKDTAEYEIDHIDDVVRSQSILGKRLYGIFTEKGNLLWLPYIFRKDQNFKDHIRKEVQDFITAKNNASRRNEDISE